MFSDTLGVFLGLLGCFRTFWDEFAYFRTFCHILNVWGCFELFWDVLGNFEDSVDPIWTNLIQFGDIYTNFELFGAISNYLDKC